MKEERIRTLHPQGKQGVHILKRRYDFIKQFIINTIKEKGEIAFTDLNRQAKDELSGRFDGKITWYIVSVKLDLEARSIIERIDGTSPQRLRLKE